MLMIEYLPDGSDDCPLIRLYGFDRQDVAALERVCLDLSERRMESVELNTLTWVRSVDGYRHTWAVGPSGCDATLKKDVTAFSLEQDCEGWLQAAGLIAGVASWPNSFNWLHDQDPVRVLLSWDGCW